MYLIHKTAYKFFFHNKRYTRLIHLIRHYAGSNYTVIHIQYIGIIAGRDTFTDGNYSKLGVQDKDTKNNSHLASQKEQEETDEEDDYFILEGPESEDQNNASGCTGAEIMGGATDYEVPVQRKKSNK